MKYLAFEDRVKIETLLKIGESFSTIANQLGVSRALISIEINRSVPDRWPNKYKAIRYDARRAQYLSDQRRTKNRHKNNSKLTPTRIKYIKQRILEDKWSPEQIVHGTPKINVGVSTIYTWINRNQVPGITNKDLRHKGHRYKRALSARTWKSLRSSKTDKRQSIREHTIESRPEMILKRLRFGDWELDGVESKKSNALVLTFVERKTRYAVAIKVPSKHANDIKLGIDTFMSRFQYVVKSITCDRGSEFLAASTQQCFKDYNVDYYYAHAYAPYERGSNENFNNLLRDYFPKGTDFNKVTQKMLSDAVSSINNRPMKLHRFKSRLSAFERHVKYHLRYQNC